MNLKPLRARYVGYVNGTENHGDEALMWLIRDLLAPEIEIVLDADGPYDLALLGGGTLINQAPWLIDHFEQVLNSSLSGCGVVMGSGVGDPRFWGDHFERWRALLERCGPVGVRGPNSLALLRDRGFDRAVCIGDPYLWLRRPVERPFVVRHLGVNLGVTNDALWGGSDKAFLDYMTEALGQLKARGWTFCWLSVWSHDLPLLEEVRRRVAPDSAPVLDARTQTLEAYSALAGCELFLGEKLHACAMAAVAGVPFIAMEYQPKVRDFTSSLGLERWIVSTAERDIRGLISVIEEMGRQRLGIGRALELERDGLRSRLEGFVAGLKRWAHQKERSN